MKNSISNIKAREQRILQQTSRHHGKDSNLKVKDRRANIFARLKWMFALAIFSALPVRQFADLVNTSSELSLSLNEFQFSPSTQEMVVSVSSSPDNTSNVTDEHATTIMAAPPTTTTTTTSTPPATTGDNNKPRLVLHIGPPKTGTTSIQCGLIGLNQTLASLDNYYYIGKPCGVEGNKHEMLRMHYVLYDLVNGNSPADTMVQLLDRHLKLGHNVIMSSENWSQRDNSKGGLEALLKALVGFDVTIVTAYRYYHEWLPSVYFQQNNRPKFFGNHDVVTPTFEKYMDSHDSFLSKVDDYHDDKIMNTTTGNSLLTTMMEQVHHHPTVSSMLRYSKHFKNVAVFDMHDAGQKQKQNHSNGNGNDISNAVAVDLVTNFVCRALPTAEKTCELLQLRQKQQQQQQQQRRPKNTAGNEIENERQHPRSINLRSSTAMQTNILSSFAFSRAQQSPTFSTKIGVRQKKWRHKNAAKTKEQVFGKITAAVKRLFSDRYFPSSSSIISTKGEEDAATATSATTIGNSTMNTTLAVARATAGKELIRTDVPLTCPSVEKLDKLLSMSMAFDKFITSRREWQDMYYYPKNHDTDEAGDHGGVDESNNQTDSSGKNGPFSFWLSETRSTRDSDIRERFAKSVAGQKFCSIDLEAIRSDPFWIDFLDSLDPIDLWLKKQTTVKAL